VLRLRGSFEHAEPRSDLPPLALPHFSANWSGDVTTACTFTLHKVWQPVRPDFHRWDANTACTFTLRTRHGRRHVPLAFACLLCTHQMYCIRLLHGLGTPVPGRMECPATQGLVISQKCVHTPIRTLNGLSAVQNTSHSRGRGRGAGERSSLAPRDARQHAVRATALACELRPEPSHETTRPMCHDA